MKPSAECLLDVVVTAFIVLALASILAVLASGCATRTIYIPHGDPVRLAADVPDHPVWVQDAEGRWVRGRVTLKEGWYALPKP